MINGNSGRMDISEVTCSYCKEKGHYKSNCPKLAAKKGRAVVEAGRIVWLWMRAGGGTVCKDMVG